MRGGAIVHFASGHLVTDVAVCLFFHLNKVAYMYM